MWGLKCVACQIPSSQAKYHPILLSSVRVCISKTRGIIRRGAGIVSTTPGWDEPLLMSQQNLPAYVKVFELLTFQGVRLLQAFYLKLGGSLPKGSNNLAVDRWRGWSSGGKDLLPVSISSCLLHHAYRRQGLYHFANTAEKCCGLRRTSSG